MEYCRLVMEKVFVTLFHHKFLVSVSAALGPPLNLLDKLTRLNPLPFRSNNPSQHSQFVAILFCYETVTYQRAHLIIAPVFDHVTARCFDPNTYLHEENYFFSLL